MMAAPGCVPMILLCQSLLSYWIWSKAGWAWPTARCRPLDGNPRSECLMSEMDFGQHGYYYSTPWTIFIIQLG